MTNKTNLPIRSLHYNGGEEQTKETKNIHVEMSTRDKSITDINNKVMGGKGTGILGESGKACSRKRHFNCVLRDNSGEEIIPSGGSSKSTRQE